MMLLTNSLAVRCCRFFRHWRWRSPLSWKWRYRLKRERIAFTHAVIMEISMHYRIITNQMHCIINIRQIPKALNSQAFTSTNSNLHIQGNKLSGFEKTQFFFLLHVLCSKSRFSFFFFFFKQFFLTKNHTDSDSTCEICLKSNCQNHCINTEIFKISGF